MDTNALKKIKRKMFFLFPLTFMLLAAMFFLPAGSLYYWSGWVLCFLLLLPMFFVAIYFLKRSPEFLERRINYKEKEYEQKVIIKIASIIFFLGFLVPGLDYRFGWSAVPVWLVIVSDILILVSYYLVFLSFKENAFAARTVEVFAGQKVISTGPYAVVRHPMYVGLIMMFLFIPLALGSFWALLFFIPVCAIVIVRILNEEKVSQRDLPGYKEYCEKVRYRLVPFVW
jgi:protein-S-isoprenylcysteine O-methyltransferase Ste14